MDFSLPKVKKKKRKKKFKMRVDFGRTPKLSVSRWDGNIFSYPLWKLANDTAHVSLLGFLRTVRHIKRILAIPLSGRRTLCNKNKGQWTRRREGRKERGRGGAAAAAAKSLQSCPTLCDPIDGSPPGSPVPGILQARTLEWVAMSCSNAWKWKVKVKSLSRVWLLRPHGLQPTRLLHPWDSPGKSTGVGCHCLLQRWCKGILLSGSPLNVTDWSTPRDYSLRSH